MKWYLQLCKGLYSIKQKLKEFQGRKLKCSVLRSLLQQAMIKKLSLCFIIKAIRIKWFKFI